MNGEPNLRVLVWRTDWLPRSNTFVRDQLQAYSRYSAHGFGLTRVADPLVEPAGHVFAAGPWGSALRRRSTPAMHERLATRTARQLNPSLMHVHFGTDAIFAQGVAERLGVPLVVTFHGYDVTALKGKEEYVSRLRQVFTRVDLLLAVSGHIENALLSLGAPRERVLRHHTGVPLPDVRSPTDRRGVLFVGRLVEKKGAADLLKAYSDLPEPMRKQHPLTLIGEGPLFVELRDLDRRLRTQAIFTGALDSEQVSERFDRCAVACVPSKRASNGDTEGLPTVILEAAAHYAPVVASDHAGSSEAVIDGQTGLLFPESDVDALRSALTRTLADSSLRSAMGQSGRELVTQRFDIKRQTLSLEVLYDDLLASRRPLAVPRSSGGDR